MRVHDLRLILLIQAIEESDTKGELLPLVERGACDVPQAFAGEALSPAGELLLARRAQLLYERLRLRAPVIDHVLAVAGGSGARGGLIGAALFTGVLLAALDGHGYIDVLSLALLGLLAWNLLVYAFWIASRIRPHSWSGASFYDCTRVG
jgi:hypothetical protein